MWIVDDVIFRSMAICEDVDDGAKALDDAMNRVKKQRRVIVGRRREEVIVDCF